MTDYKQVANTILHQLGGNQFRAITGAKQFTSANDGRGSLQFRIPRAKGGINHVKVMLSDRDLYNVTFSRIHGSKFKTVSAQFGLYADQLTSTFTEATGLETSLGFGRARAR